MTREKKNRKPLILSISLLYMDCNIKDRESKKKKYLQNKSVFSISNIARDKNEECFYDSDVVNLSF